MNYARLIASKVSMVLDNAKGFSCNRALVNDI